MEKRSQHRFVDETSYVLPSVMALGIAPNKRKKARAVFYNKLIHN